MGATSKTVIINESIVNTIGYILQCTAHYRKNNNSGIVHLYNNVNSFELYLGGGFFIKIDYDGYLESKNELIFRTYIHNYLSKTKSYNHRNIDYHCHEIYSVANNYRLCDEKEVEEIYNKLFKQESFSCRFNDDGFRNLEINPYINTKEKGKRGILENHCILYGGGKFNRLNHFFSNYINKNIKTIDLPHELDNMNNELDKNGFGIKLGEYNNKADDNNLQEIVSLKKGISKELFDTQGNTIVNSGFMVTLRLKINNNLYNKFKGYGRIRIEEGEIDNNRDAVILEEYGVRPLNIIEIVCGIIKEIFGDICER